MLRTIEMNISGREFGMSLKKGTIFTLSNECEILSKKFLRLKDSMQLFSKKKIKSDFNKFNFPTTIQPSTVTTLKKHPLSS
jgi:hypothetical protein